MSFTTRPELREVVPRHLAACHHSERLDLAVVLRTDRPVDPALPAAVGQDDLGHHDHLMRPDAAGVLVEPGRDRMG